MIDVETALDLLRQQPAPAFVVSDGSRFALLVDPDTQQLAAAKPPAASPQWWALDASIASEFVLAALWKVTDAAGEVEAEHSPQAALELARARAGRHCSSIPHRSRQCWRSPRLALPCRGNQPCSCRSLSRAWSCGCFASTRSRREPFCREHFDFVATGQSVRPAPEAPPKRAVHLQHLAADTTRREPANHRFVRDAVDGVDGRSVGSGRLAGSSRLTTSRQLSSSSPLGKTRGVGSADTRPTRTTSLRPSSSGCASASGATRFALATGLTGGSLLRARRPRRASATSRPVVQA